jgi:DNA-binding MarR family transcriptional regulator|tara:strand:+ start:4386 stop:4646 length:261 start_codon:yes stop_codon:yes gene_type:complete
MSRLSDKTVEKIKNDILYVLYEAKLNGMFTKHIGDEIARDDELILRLLKDMENANLVKRISNFKRRVKWVMTEEAYSKYREMLGPV